MLDATPLLRIYARRRLRTLARQDPAEAQRRELRKLIAAAGDTRFGRDHRLGRIASVEDFQRRVPLRRYEDFWAAYWKDAFPVLADISWPGTIPYFAATSGTTTGRTKYIPVSRALVAANKWAAFDLLTHHLADRPDSRVLGGKNFMLGGSTDLVEMAPGIRSGDLSGIAAREVPFWARPAYFPPPELALIADWDEKLERIGRLSLSEDIRAIGGTANWLLLFLDRLAEGLPGGAHGIASLYPRLELMVHGGVNVAPYRARFEQWLEGTRVDLREVYPASEGFLAVADRGTGDGLRLICDNGLFFEFVPVEELSAAEPRRFWLGNAETGVNYALVLSNNAGAWAYLLGDTVRLIDRNPARLMITGRTSYSLSAFGEHLIGEEIEQAVTAAAEAIGADMADYTVAPLYPGKPGEAGGHLYIVEFAAPLSDPERLSVFARVLDQRLCALNADYRDHRVPGFGIDPPQVRAAPPGTFAAWMRDRGRLGGQNKVPRIITDTDLFRSLADRVPES